jgi:hypothetical protein
MSETDETKPADKYWICSECALTRGWSLPAGNYTMIYGVCGHCKSNEEKMLTPVVDFKGPGKVQIWD